MREPKEDVRTKIYRETENGCKHGNRAYQRYFRDFVVVRSIDGKGKFRVKHVYTGVYYSQDLPHSQKVLLRIGLILLWLAAATVFAASACAKLEINRVWYVALGQAGMLLSLGWYAFRMILYLTAPEKMTVGDWQSGPRGVKRNGLCAAIICAVTALLTAVAAGLNTASGWSGMICAAGCVICGGMMFMAYRIEARVNYVNAYEQAPELRQN